MCHLVGADQSVVLIDGFVLNEPVFETCLVFLDTAVDLSVLGNVLHEVERVL